MPQQSWILFLERESISQNTSLSDREKTLAYRRHFQKLFKEVKKILPDGVQTGTLQRWMGTVLITGPDSAYLRLSEILKQNGLGELTPNCDIYAEEKRPHASRR